MQQEVLDGATDLPLRGGQARAWVERHHPYTWSEMHAFPKHLDIDTVNTCNARCTMCGIDFDRRERQRMDDWLFDKIVAELRERAPIVERVGLVVNSEPLMDRRLAERVEALKKAGLRRVSIITNGALLSPRRAAELLHAGLDMTYISIDSLDPAKYERIRVGLSFVKVLRNVEEFIRLRNEIRPSAMIRIAMVQSAEDEEEAREFADYWSRRLGRGDQVVVTRGYNWGRAQAVAHHDADQRARYDRVPCVGLWTSFSVDVTGKVLMCCADEECSHIIGDLRRQTIAEVWQGDELSRIREAHLDGRRRELELCHGCPIWSDDKHLVKKEIA